MDIIRDNRRSLGGPAIWYSPTTQEDRSVNYEDPRAEAQVRCELSTSKALRVRQCMRDTNTRILGPGIIWFVHQPGARECTRRLRYDGVAAEFIGGGTPPTVRRMRLAAYESGLADWLVMTHDSPVLPCTQRTSVVLYAEIPAPRTAAAQAIERARRAVHAGQAREIFMVFQHWCDDHVLAVLADVLSRR